MRVSVLADLQGRLIVTTSTYMTKLEYFDEIRTRGKSNFENQLLEMVSGLSRRNNYLSMKLEHRIFRESTVLKLFTISNKNRQYYKLKTSSHFILFSFSFTFTSYQDITIYN